MIITITLGLLWIGAALVAVFYWNKCNTLSEQLKYKDIQLTTEIRWEGEMYQRLHQAVIDLTAEIKPKDLPQPEQVKEDSILKHQLDVTRDENVRLVKRLAELETSNEQAKQEVLSQIQEIIKQKDEALLVADSLKDTLGKTIESYKLLKNNLTALIEEVKLERQTQNKTDGIQDNNSNHHRIDGDSGNSRVDASENDGTHH